MVICEDQARLVWHIEAKAMSPATDFGFGESSTSQTTMLSRELPAVQTQSGLYDRTRWSGALK